MIPIIWEHERLQRYPARKLSTGYTLRASNVLTARRVQGNGSLADWIRGAYTALDRGGKLDASTPGKRVTALEHDGLTLVYGMVIQPGRRDFKVVVCHPDEQDSILVDVLGVLR